MRAAISACVAKTGAAACAPSRVRAHAAATADDRPARRDPFPTLCVIIRPTHSQKFDARAALYGPKVPPPFVCCGRRRRTTTRFLLVPPLGALLGKVRVGSQRPGDQTTN